MYILLETVQLANKNYYPQIRYICKGKRLYILQYRQEIFIGYDRAVMRSYQAQS